MAVAEAPIGAPIVPWWMVLVQGIAGIVLGLLLLTAPGATLLLLIQFLGFYWFISGIFSIVSIFLDRTGWVWNLLSGILGIIAGLYIIQHPLWSAVLVPATLVIFLGVQGLIIGAIQLFAAFRGGGLGAGILGGLSVLFGLLLLFNPLVGAAALPWALGFLALAGGIAAIFTAFQVRGATT